MKRLSLMLCAALMLCASALAQAAPDPRQAQALIEDTVSRMQQTLLANRDELQRDASKINTYVREILLPRIDFETIAKLVLGKHWRGASAQQRQRFTDEFRELMVRTYAKALLEYLDAEVGVMSVQPSNRDNRVTVRSQVILPDGERVPLDYTVCHKDSWKVCNIVIDRSINFVVNYRQQIGSQVQSQGLDAVIDELSRRNVQGA